MAAAFTRANFAKRERERERERNETPVSPPVLFGQFARECRCSSFWKFLCVLPPLITELRMFTESRYTKPSKSLERSPRSLPNISRNIARVGRLIFVIPCRPHSIYRRLVSSRSRDRRRLIRPIFTVRGNDVRKHRIQARVPLSFSDRSEHRQFRHSLFDLQCAVKGTLRHVFFFFFSRSCVNTELGKISFQMARIVNDMFHLISRTYAYF